MKRKILIALIITGGLSLVAFLVTLIYMPTPGEALKATLRKNSITIISTASPKDLKDKDIKRDDALAILGFLENDVLNFEPKNPCDMLQGLMASPFFLIDKDDGFNDYMWGIVTIGREANTDPVAEVFLRTFDYFKRFKSLKKLMAIAKEELELGHGQGAFTTLKQKAKVMKLSGELTLEIEADGLKNMTDHFAKRVEPLMKFFQFLHHHPELITGPETQEACATIDQSEHPQQAFKDFLRAFGLQDWQMST